ncbi:hypothetical protein A2U01_0117444, partial [Trifolium medium]|nr:hypothetical protein [Trifolium medium]
MPCATRRLPLCSLIWNSPLCAAPSQPAQRVPSRNDSYCLLTERRNAPVPLRDTQ